VFEFAKTDDRIGGDNLSLSSMLNMKIENKGLRFKNAKARAPHFLGL
jgi:hypothetical protein